MASFPKGQNSARDSFFQLSEVQNSQKQQQYQEKIYQDEDEPYNTTIRKSHLSRSQRLDNIFQRELVQSPQKKAQSFFIFNKMTQQNDWIPQQNRKKGDPNYDVLDLTFTLIVTEINLAISGSIFFILVVLRYYTLGCLIFVVTRAPDEWQWVLVIIFIRFLYFVQVLRVSLNTAQTKTQIILKTYWNSKDVGVHQLFEVIDFKKLMTSICRALIPPQLSFLYLRTKSQKKKFQIFTAINYIYSSMEMIVYYPFFIIYCAIINPDKGYALNVINPNFTIFLAIIGQAILFSLSIYLLLVGFYKKYGTLNCFQSKKYDD